MNAVIYNPVLKSISRHFKKIFWPYVKNSPTYKGLTKENRKIACDRFVEDKICGFA
jgi:hypothetical protein